MDLLFPQKDLVTWVCYAKVSSIFIPHLNLHVEWIRSLCSSFEEGGILYLKLDAIIMATHPSLVQEISLVRAVPKPAFKTALSD